MVEAFTSGRFTSLVIRSRRPRRPSILGEGHIEIVPGRPGLFRLRQEGPLLFGRGVADMKTQCLMMMTVLRDLPAAGEPNEFWLVLPEDEEIGSAHGAKPMVKLMGERDHLPDVVSVPDGGPYFAYVEKE